MANWIYPEDEYQESEARVFEERAQALLSRFRTVAPRTPFQRAAEEPPTVPPWQQGRFGGHEVEETAPSAPSDRFSRSLGAYGRSVLRETPNEIARDMRPLPAPIPVPGVPLLARGLSAIADPLLRAGQQGLLQGIRGIQEVQPLAEVGRGALEGLAGTRPDVSYGELRRAYGVRDLPGPEVPVPGPLRGLTGTATFKPVDTAVDLMGEMTLDPLNAVPIPLAKGAKAGEALLSQAGPATQKAMRQLLDALPEAAYRSADDVATALRGAFTNLADDEVQAVTRLVDARARAFGEVYGLDPTAWYKRLAGIRPGAETGAVELAQQGLGPIKGAVRFLDDGRALITAFESHDVSTALHEFGHVFRRDLLPADLQRVESWAGITDGQWTVEAEERFARGFEQYLRAGESPVAGLQDIFAQFKAWLTAIYRQVQGSEIDVPVSPEVRQAFDSLLTTERPGGAVAGAGLVPSTGQPEELFQRGGIPARGHPDRIADYPSIAELKAWVAGKAPTGALSTIQQLPGIKQVASAIDPMSTIRPTIPVIGDIPVEYVAPISRMLRSIGRQTLRQMDSELRAIDLSAYSIGDDGRWATGVTPKVPGASLALNDVLEHPGNYDFVNDNLREFVETFDQILTTANDRAKALGIQVHERELPAGEFYFPRIVQQVQEAVARTRTSPDMPRKFDSQEAALQSGVRYDTDLYAIANAALDYRLRQMETKYLGEVVSPMGLTPREIIIAKHPQTFATEDDAKRELGIARRGLNMLKAIKSGVDPYQTRQQADGSYVRTLRRSIRDMDQLTPGFSTMVKVLMANKGFASQEAQKAASGELSYAFQHLRTQGTQDYATVQRQVHQALDDYRQASQAAIRAAHDQMDASAGGYDQAMATAQQALDQQRAAAAQFLHETVNQYRSATELWGPGVAGSRKALKEAKAVIGEAQRALGLIDEAAEHQMSATSVDARGHLVEAITGLRQADLAARQAARAQADLALQMQRQSQLRTQAEALLVAQNALPTQRRVDLDPWRDLMDYVLDQAEVLAEAKRGAYETARKARESRMEKATKSEFEPGRVFERPEGTISTSYVDLPYLAGRRLPIEVAEYLKKHVVHHENTYDRWLQNINLVNGLVKATKAGFDFGVLGIHNAAVMIYKPKAYMRGAWALFEAMRDLRSYDEYVSDPALKPMLNDLTSNNFTWEGNEYTEGFSTIAGLAGRLPEGLGIAKRVATGLARRAEAAFLVPLMVTKIEIAKALYPRFKAQGKVKELAEFLNDLTGTQSSLSQGIGESQRAVENLAVFSSRYTRSGFSMLGRTLQGGPAAAEARKALGAMFTGLPAILAGYAIASGQEITPDFFNPMSSHFLEVGVGNRRVSFGGFYFGFARLVGSVARTAAEGHPEKLVTASRQDNPLLRYATGRGSPLATLATTVATGRTYNNTPIEDAGDMAQELARTLIPLSVQDIVAPEEGEERPTPAAAAANAVGLRTLPYTESQRRDLLENQLAQERYGKSWDALDVDEQEVLRGDPKLRAAMRAALEGRSKKGDVQARFWLTVEDERKQIEAQIAEINRLNRLPTTNERHLGGRAYRERLAKLESQIAELPESLRRAPEYRGVPLTEEEKVKAYPGYTPSALPVADYVRRYHGLTKTHTDPVTGVVDVDALLAARRAMAETAPEGVRTRAEGHIGRKRDPEYREALKQYDEYQAMVTDSGLDREEWRRAERFNRIVADTMRTMTFGSREGRRRAAETLAAEVFPGGEDAYHLMRLFLRSRFGKQWVQERRQYWAERPLLQRYFTDAVLEEDAA